MTRQVEGTVYILNCEQCGQESPHLVFSGDTDMATMGLVSLTSAVANEIVILEARPAEWSEPSGQMVETRINQLLSRDDLRYVSLLRAEEVAYPAGLSFQEFQAAYRVPRIFYSCPRCAVGEAASGRALGISEYRREGGRLTQLGELALRD